MMCKLLIGNFIVLFLLSTGTSGAAKERCDSQEELLKQCAMELPMLRSSDQSFATNKEELEKSCIELKNGIRCIYNYTDTCMEPQERTTFKRIYSGITEVVHHLCIAGNFQDDYLKYAPCVKTVRPEYEQCSQNYENVLSKLRNQDIQSDVQSDNRHEDYLKTVCCAFQEYLSCSERTVQRTCGDDAALFTSAFLKRMSSNLIKNFCFEYRGRECGMFNKASYWTPNAIYAATIVLIPLAYNNVLRNFDPV